MTFVALFVAENNYFIVALLTNDCSYIYKEENDLAKIYLIPNNLLTAKKKIIIVYSMFYSLE